MRVLWRISNYSDLFGLGGERGDARWHTARPGRRIVYLAENAATALIEALANLKGNPQLFPETYQLLKIEAPNAVVPLPGPPLSPHWAESLPETQSLGNEWLESGRSALLAVPSVPAPESTNYLLNPLHRDAARLRIASVRRIAYDKRLFHLIDTK
jgi:RES domain-containing protein